jgi:hypothetical protein
MVNGMTGRDAGSAGHRPTRRVQAGWQGGPRSRWRCCRASVSTRTGPVDTRSATVGFRRLFHSDDDWDAVTQPHSRLRALPLQSLSRLTSTSAIASYETQRNIPVYYLLYSQAIHPRVVPRLAGTGRRPLRGRLPDHRPPAAQRADRYANDHGRQASCGDSAPIHQTSITGWRLDTSCRLCSNAKLAIAEAGQTGGSTTSSTDAQDQSPRPRGRSTLDLESLHWNLGLTLGSA